MLHVDIIVIIVIAMNIVFSLKGFNDFSFFERYKFNIGGIRRGEQIRMLSSGFLHADMQHMFFNMLTLYFFADTVIDKLGTIKFLAVYFGSLIVGSLFSLFFHKDEYHYSAVGASGAVSGILFSSILFDPDRSIMMPFPMPGYIFAVGYLLFSIYGMKNKTGNIGHDAHFGGASGGYVITLMLAPWLFQEDLLMIGLLAIPIIILFVMQRLGKL